MQLKGDVSWKLNTFKKKLIELKWEDCWNLSVANIQMGLVSAALSCWAWMLGEKCWATLQVSQQTNCQDVRQLLRCCMRWRLWRIQADFRATASLPAANYKQWWHIKIWQTLWILSGIYHTIVVFTWTEWDVVCIGSVYPWHLEAYPIWDTGCSRRKVRKYNFGKRQEHNVQLTNCGEELYTWELVEWSSSISCWGMKWCLTWWTSTNQQLLWLAPSCRNMADAAFNGTT